MKITVFAHGKINYGPEYDLISKFQKRVNKRFNNNSLSSLRIIESNEKEEKFNNRLEFKMDSFWPTVVLDRCGERISSDEFAKFLNDASDSGTKDIAFIIGGAAGVSKSIINKAQKVFSISEMILPHKIARLVLVEQIYRAKCILNGHPYHKN